MDKQEIFDIGITDVSTTLLLTLYSHALESRSKDPIIRDPKAEEIVAKLNKELEKSNNRLYQDLANGKLNKSVIVRISIRAKKYDEYVQNFLKQWPAGVIVNIGCGLNTRFRHYDRDRSKNPRQSGHLNIQGRICDRNDGRHKQYHDFQKGRGSRCRSRIFLARARREHL